MGLNGAGKTTMMDIITGSDQAGHEGVGAVRGRQRTTSRGVSLETRKSLRFGTAPYSPEADRVQQKARPPEVGLACQPYLNVDHSVRCLLFWRESKAEWELIEKVLETAYPLHRCA